MTGDSPTGTRLGTVQRRLGSSLRRFLIDVVLPRLPVGVVSALGRLQFRIPLLRRLALRANADLTEREGVIAHGIGSGLRFDARGGQPGYLLGTSEPDEQEVLSRHLGPGDVFYDIGANIGFFSTLAARLVGPSGQVHAFEPFAESAERARRNAALNGFDHVQVIEAGVSDRAGAMRLALSSTSTLHRLASDGEDGEGPQVRVVSIDGWRAGDTGVRSPSLVMIDVEGAELEVLAGMRDTLREHRPVVLCEVHWLGERFLSFVESELTPLGYALSALEGPAAIGVDRWHALLVPRG